MANRFMIAAFFLTRGGSPRTLDELAALAGMYDAHWDTPPVELGRHRALLGCWDGLSSAWASLDEFEFHDCLQIAFSDSQLFAMHGPLPEADAPQPALDADGALPVALAFRTACERLQTEVGMLLTLPQQAKRAWIADQYWMVAHQDTAALVREHLGLLYLDSRLAVDWQRVAGGRRRDSLPASKGILVFAGAGWARWF